MRSLLLALQLALAPTGRAPAPADATVWARVERAARTFLRGWRDAWEETQDDRATRGSDDLRDADLRTLAAHCHWVETPWSIRAHVITGPVRAHASCPIWSPDGAAVEDERRGIDGGLKPELRAAIRDRRGALRALLDSAAALLPGDLRLTRQRVRFALDDGDLRGAWAATAACAGEPAQCGLLRGLVRYREGDAAAADSTFLAALRLMPDDERCAWSDVGPLLEPEARRAYTRTPCAARGDLEARLWWLADPLYLEPGNERRAEHLARKVLVSIVAPLGDGDRQRWQPRKGGDAVTETLVRYGWPARVYWPGPMVDDGHDDWLISHMAETAGPYVVREYTRGRLHTVPSTSALRAPLRAAPDDWQLDAPADDRDWWPREHYARDRGAIVELPAGQGVMLRRRDAARFVWAGDLAPRALARAAGDSVRATLFESRTAERVASVGAFGGRVGAPLVVDAPLGAGDALVGIEFPGDTTRPAARTRFAVSAPAPLSALGGGRGLSQPLLFDPPTGGGAAHTLDADAAMRRMYGTTTFTGARRVGIYWEAYGFAPTDTVETTVRVTREDRPGFFERLGSALHLGGGGGSAIGVRSREVPGGGRAIHRMEGEVPVQMRSLVLELSQLRRGRYRLTLVATTPDGATATSDRMIELR